MIGEITQLVDQFRLGNLPIQAYLHSLEAAFERREPVIFSFVPEPHRWERLARDIAALEEKYPNPEERPSLYGLPVGVKDIFHVAGLPTLAGSQLPAEVLTGPESTAVTQLKEAGALIIGKTVTTEFAYFAPGPTRNPHNPFHTPGGSSSGSAAAVAAGLCPVAIGTQTIGSINRPAAFCGVVGFKPTYDRISKENVIENATSHDHVGFFIRDVASGEPIAQILCKDWKPRPVLKPKEVTLGIPQGQYLHATEPDMLGHFYSISRRLEKAGYTIKRIPAMPNFPDIHRHHIVVNEREAADYHEQFSDYFHLYHEKTLQLVSRGREHSNEALADGRLAKQNTLQHLTRLMNDYEIDAWIMPGATGAAPEGYASTGNPIMQLPWTNAGMPTLNLPSGATPNGLPLSLQLAARANEDEILFAIAQEIAQILNV